MVMITDSVGSVKANETSRPEIDSIPDNESQLSTCNVLSVTKIDSERFTQTCAVLLDLGERVADSKNSVVIVRSSILKT